MKRFLAVVMTALMLILLCACNNKTVSDDNLIINQKPDTKDASRLDFPAVKRITTEESDSVMGRRFSFTLSEFTDMLNDSYVEMSDGEESSAKFSIDKWKVLSTGLSDDNEVSYSSYYYQTDTVTLIASIEDDSGKVMNVGCGSPYHPYDKESQELQDSVMLMSAMMSAVAGGYDLEDIEFIYNIFSDVAESEKSFLYNDCAYMMNLKQSDDGDSTLLFICSPVSEKAAKNMELSDYREYKSSK